MKKLSQCQSSRRLKTATQAVELTGSKDYNTHAYEAGCGTRRDYHRNTDDREKKRTNNWTFHKHYLLLWGPRDDLGEHQDMDFLMADANYIVAKQFLYESSLICSQGDG